MRREKKKEKTDEVVQDLKNIYRTLCAYITGVYCNLHVACDKQKQASEQERKKAIK